MTSRALAWRTVTAEPARAVLTVTGVAVIGALLLNMLLLSRGLLVSFRDLLDTAGYDVRVSATDGFTLVRLPIPNATALMTEIAALPEVQEVAVIRRDRAVIRGPGRGTVVTLISVSDGADRRAWRLVAGERLGQGRPIEQSPPLIVNRTLADRLGLTPGSTVRLRIPLGSEPSAMPAVTFAVVGVAEFDFETSGELIASTTLAAFRRVAENTRDEADLVMVVSRPPFGAAAAIAAIKRQRPDVRGYSNEQIVAQINQNGFAYFRQISIVLSTITLGFAFLLVATLLTVSVNQRLGEVAALRALGFPRRRIGATLLWESAWLVGAGGLLSLPVGGVMAVEFDRILRAMPGIPERVHFFVFEPRTVVLHLALLAVTGLAAAVHPMWMATRLPIAATLRRETIS